MVILTRVSSFQILHFDYKVVLQAIFWLGKNKLQNIENKSYLEMWALSNEMVWYRKWPWGFSLNLREPQEEIAKLMVEIK